MISLVQNIPAGNAVRLLITPAVGVTKWRVLRKSSDDFTGYNDPAAVLVHDGDHLSIVDTEGLVNGATYYYRDYGWNGSTWIAGPSEAATPAATYQDHSTDVVQVLRERLAAGLQVECQRGALSHELNKIPVLLAPPTFEDTKWPVVVIHVSNDADNQRFVGEAVERDEFDADAFDWNEFEGWLSMVQIAVVGWALNPDVRKELRKAIKRVLIANLSVFDAKGMYQISVSQQDIEDFQTYAAPVYQVMTTFSCLTQSAVSAVTPAITDATATVAEVHDVALSVGPITIP